MRLLIILLTSLLFLGYACTSSQPAAGRESSSESLYQYQWDLFELKGKPITQTERVQPHLLLYPGEIGRIAGSAGCNQIAGKFELSGDHTLHISPIMTTKMACPDQDLETQLMRTLGEVDGWGIADKVLELRIGKKVAARFTGVTPGQKM